MGHSDGKQTGRRLLGLPAKRLDEADGISRVLKKADSSDTGGPCGEAGCDVFQRNSADGEDGNVYGATNFGETLKSLGRAERGLRGGGEDRSKEQEVCAGGRRRLGRFERMERHANEKIGGARVGGLISQQQTFRLIDGKRIFA